jgi:transcriptional regulator with XRE-family HTH domain
MPLRKDFGHRLRSIRQERRMTQEQFAEKVGISVDFLSLIERGVNAPSFETIEQMAKRLRLPVMSLFHFSDRGRSQAQQITLRPHSSSSSS